MTHKEIVNTVALHQLGICDFSIFEINSKGITGKLSRDNVAEFAAIYQRILSQTKIEVGYIKHLEDIKLNPFEEAEKDARRVAKALKMDPDKYVKELISQNKKWAAYKKQQSKKK